MIQNVIENDAEIDYDCEKATWEFKHQRDYWINLFEVFPKRHTHGGE